MLIGPTTRLAGVIGSPIAHSLSPAIMNAAFEASRLDWVYLAFDVGEAEVPEALAAVRSLGLSGLSVTLPGKAAAAAAVDRLSVEAELLGAVNCVVVDDGDLVGHNTDGAGFVDAIRLDLGIEPEGLSVVLFGAGGAARAVAAALGRAGAQVTVVNRTAERAVRAASLAGGDGRVGTVDDVSDAALIVNATSIGMGSSGVPAVPVEHLSAHHVIVDLVYEPLETPLLVAAREAGATAVNGVGMLVHQAGHQYRLWTGGAPPIDAMRAAAESAVAAR